MQWPLSAREIHDRVLRSTLEAPGYVWLDLGRIDSLRLRQGMLELKGLLSPWTRLVIRNLGRYDQQESTRFHLDGGPATNLLVLGYEPTPIASRLFLADPHAAGREQGVDPQALIGAAMISDCEEGLKGYVVELPQPQSGCYYLLIVNNSANGLSLMHKAVVPHPDESQQRIVNSLMLATEGEDLPEAEQQAFAQTRDYYGKRQG